MSSKGTLPFISIILPIRNEEHFITSAIEAVLAQDYPSNLFEIIIAEGMSTDGTRKNVQRLREKYPNIRLIQNPKKIVPTGLNLAIYQSKGDVVVRMDAHCQYPKDYVTRLTNLLGRTGAANVGGALIAVGNSTYAQNGIRIAYQSSLSVGGALRSYDSDEFTKEVDAVHGGCWYKETLLSVGCFDEAMVRNQDDELSFRIRKQGGRILQDASIRVKYYVRDSFSKLFKQFSQYGYWKVLVIRKHPKQASLRHFFPPVLVAGLIVFALLSPFYFYARMILGLLVLTYFGSLVFASFIVILRSADNLQR